MSFHMQQAIGSENNKEYNQCVTHHLALALEWRMNGKLFEDPPRTRVDVIAEELRDGEFAQAQLRCNHIGTPVTVREHELWAAIHDAMCIGHDRGFKRLGWPFEENCPQNRELCIRIFDYEEGGGKQFVTVYQYCRGAEDPTPRESNNFIVSDNHIRLMLPSTETYPGSRKRWREFVDIFRPTARMSWRETLGGDTTPPWMLPNLHAMFSGANAKRSLLRAAGRVGSAGLGSVKRWRATSWSGGRRRTHGYATKKKDIGAKL